MVLIHLEVIAENGEKRTYVVTFDEFYEPIVGDYAVEQLWMYGGTGRNMVVARFSSRWRKAGDGMLTENQLQKRIILFL